MHGYYPRRRTRYNDGFLEMAKKGWDLIKVPLKSLGDAGLRVLGYASSAVKFLILIQTTHAVYNYVNAVNALDRLKTMAEQLNWSNELINATMGDHKKQQIIKLGLQLLKGAIALAITLISDKIIAAGKKKLRER